MRVQATDSTMEAVFRERYKTSSPPPYRYIVIAYGQSGARGTWWLPHARLYIRIYTHIYHTTRWRRRQRGVCTRLSTLRRTWKGVAFQRGWFLKSDPESGRRMAFLVFIHVLYIFFLPRYTHVGTQYNMYILMIKYSPLQQFSSPMYLYTYYIHTYTTHTRTNERSVRWSTRYVCIMCVVYILWCIIDPVYIGGPDERELSKLSRIHIA